MGDGSKGVWRKVLAGPAAPAGRPEACLGGARAECPDGRHLPDEDGRTVPASGEADVMGFLKGILTADSGSFITFLIFLMIDRDGVGPSIWTNVYIA